MPTDDEPSLNADEIVDEILPDDVNDPMAAVAQKSDSPAENSSSASRSLNSSRELTSYSAANASCCSFSSVS